MVVNIQQPLPVRRLSYRSAFAEDLEPAFQICGAPFAYQESIRPQVPQVWQKLLQQNTLITTVIEEADTDGRQQLVGFCAAAFVTDEFMTMARQRDRPYVRNFFVELILQGASPVLSFTEAQAANHQEGLNLFFFSDTLANPHLSEEQLSRAYGKWSEALYELQAFQIKEVLWELYGDFAMTWPQGCGLKYRQDWREYWQQYPHEIPPSHQRPYLVGLTREESKTQYGTHSSYLFVHTPSRTLFTTLQQELLRHALQGETDDELAKSLNLSLSTVKKRWQSIYDQVWLLAPDILAAALNEPEPILGADDDLFMRKRGSEKRRHLLNYLRHHPEEIHPINAATGLAVNR